MKIVVDLSVTSGPHRSHWHPGLLFRSGGKGGWFDPSDISTLFEDADGTIALTAPGQAVGFLSDRSGNALHAIQSAHARPTYGRTPYTGRRNLSPLSEPTFAQLAASPGVADAATGLPGFDGTIQFPGGAVGNRIAYRDHGVTASAQFTLSCFVQMDDGMAPVPGVDFVLVVGNTPGATGYHEPIEVRPGLWRVARTATSLSVNPANTGVLKTDTHSGRGFRVSGFQAEPGSAVTAYQRARSQFDITEAGQRDCYYLYFGGPDDPRSMITPNIDLTHTSQVTVVAAVEKLGNPAVRGTVVNFADNGFRNFSLEVPLPSSNDTRWLHAGNSVLRSVTTTHAVGDRVLYTGTSDIAAPLLRLRANGVQVGQDVSLTGGGPFKSGPLALGDYVTPTGRRFHGRLFNLLVIDRVLTAAEIAIVEGYMARKAGVTL